MDTMKDQLANRMLAMTSNKDKNSDDDSSYLDSSSDDESSNIKDQNL